MADFKVPAVSLPVKESPTVPEDLSEKKPPSDKSAPPSAQSQCPYIEPKWSCCPNASVNYKFEVLKSGSIVEVIENLQNKPFWVFGRLAANDIVMAHPTISRFHAVLQYRPNLEKSTASEESDNESNEKKFGEGWYIYDLTSTHGTFLNKMPIPPKTYIPVRVGHMITLGASTRRFILQGPKFDEEPESELTITELKEQRLKQEEERKKQQQVQEELREKEGISWGMGEDADEETDLTVNPYASTNNEELFLNDPKKTLRGFFEREGLNLDYNVDEMSPGTFVCKIELPIDDTNGRPIVAEICHKGKKKDCVLQCALEACRILDRHGVLRQSHHEPMKRRAPTADSDDDDDFLDRTGDVERKKIRKATQGQSNALTYEDLLKQQAELFERISTIKDKILQYQDEAKRAKEAQDNDDLDDFMKNLSSDKKMDKSDIRKLRVEEQRLEAENQKLQRLIKIAKPIDLSSISTTSADSVKKKSFLPLFGKRNKTRFQLPKATTVTQKIVEKEKELKSDEEEMEEEDEPALNIQIDKDTERTEKPCSENTDRLTIETASGTEESASSRVKGPAFIPPDLLQNEDVEEHEDKPKSRSISPIPNKSLPDENNKSPEPSDSAQQEDEEMSEQAAENLSKKRRARTRLRLKGRENVDIDDKEELEDEEKYSGWVPPQNQTGDGTTLLNEKFGY